jgi:heme exporter protein D
MSERSYGFVVWALVTLSVVNLIVIGCLTVLR